MIDIAVLSFFFIIVGVFIGLKLQSYYAVDYRQRWQEALEIIKEEQLVSKELKKLPPPLPERLMGKHFVPFEYNIKNVPSEQRKNMELHRLELGLPPQDAMGEAQPKDWTEVRMKQLEYGWEWHKNSDGWYKIK